MLPRRISFVGSCTEVTAAWSRPPEAIAPTSEQAVLRGEEARGHAGGRIDLRVDVLDVVASRLGRDHELGGDLLARQAARDQPQDVDLAGRQSGRPLAAPADVMPAAARTAATASASSFPALASASSSAAACSTLS